MKNIGEETWDSLKEQLDVNVGGAFHLIKALLPEWEKENSTKLFFTGGGFGIDPHPDFLGIGVGKAALRNLVQATVKQLAGKQAHLALVTIYGQIGGPDPQYAPDKIAKHYWNLYTQKQGAFETEVIY